MEVRLARRWDDDPPELGQELLLERQAEVGIIARALTDARAGRGSVVLVQGPSGAGKSRLIGTVESHAACEGMDLLAASCDPKERQFDFGVALQLFENRLAGADEADRARLLSGPAGLAAPLLSGRRRVTASEGEAFIQGLYWLCRHLADQRPIALCVDDVHVADQSSLHLLLYLARRVRELPLAVVLTSRSGPPRGRSDAVVEAIAAGPAVHTVRLRSLSVDAVARLAAGVLHGNVSEELSRACWTSTGGNPFLVGELLAELAAHGVVADHRAAARVPELGPPSIARAATSHLASLDASAHALSSAVAVLGPDAEVRHAAALAGLDGASASAVAATLMEAHVLRRGDRLTFVHPIVGRSLYLAMAPTERGEAHRRAAGILAGEHAAPEGVAVHLLAATATRDPGAVALLSAGAEQALARADPGSAVRYLRRAMAEPPSAPQRAEVTLALGRAEALAGEPESAARLNEALGLIGPPAERAQAALEMARILFARGERGEALAAMERGAAQLEDGDDRLRMRLEAALLVGRGLGLPSGQGAGTVSGWGSTSRDAASGSPAERLLLAERAGRQALSGEPHDKVARLAIGALAGGALLEDETSDGLGYYLAASALTLAGELEPAERAVVAAFDEAVARGSVLGRATASYFLSFASWRRGRIHAAAEAARAAIDGQRHGWRLALSGAHALLAATMIERGDLDGAARELDAVNARDGGLAGLPECLHMAVAARLALTRGDAEAALSGYLDCGRRLEEVGAANPAVLGWRGGAARAAAQLADPSQALDLANEELRLARGFGAPAPIGRALHALGQVARGDAGLEALRASVGILEGSGASLDRARALVDYGAALRRAGKRGDARQPLRLGMDLATRCGAGVLAKRALEETVAAGSRPRRTATTGIEALTPREQQVVELAARGLSNREISETLFVTLKTVEWHLRHAYGKLEVSSRHDLSRVLEASGAVA